MSTSAPEPAPQSDGTIPPTSDQTPVQSAAAVAPQALPLKFPVAVLGAYWAFTLVCSAFEMHYFFRWVSGMAASALVALSLAVWWLRNRRIRFRDRMLGTLVLLGGGVGASLVADKSYNIFTLVLYCLPVVLTMGTLWLLLLKRTSFPFPRAGLALVMLATWGFFTLLRNDGINGELKSSIHWRWTPTAEELFLAETRRAAAANGDRAPAETRTAEPIEIAPGDWPGFRGPLRDGILRGERIATDWSAKPPRLLWKRRVGPAWSSFAVIGERVYTQEQRGESEVVLCLDAASGRENWAHHDAVRFWDAVAGAGPRATPTFESGRIYSQGATGILNCLDAATGELYWSRDITVDSGAKPPLWGFSSSPLVADGVVITFAGGENGKGVLAYNAETGESAWCIASGPGSYSSPQRATLGGRAQVLMLSDAGLTAIDAGTGTELWNYGSPSPGAPISLQPLALDDGRILMQSGADSGMALVEVARGDESWTVNKKWATTNLRPSFNDFVVRDQVAFGFDGPIFSCFDLKTQKRRWKQGRYGYGEVLLLAEQGLLVVVAETGEVVLLAANPDRHEELGRFEAIAGKTWNHPVVAHGRLFVRNAEEMACFEVGATETPIESAQAD